MDDNQQPTSEGQQSSNTRPAAKFAGSGGLSIAVWKQRSEQGYDNYSVRIDRSYKDGDDYQSTAYLRDSDLLRAGKLLEQADEWIEQDKGRQRSYSEGKGR